MCSNCGSGFAGFMSPHHIDLPLASPAQELPFDRESAGEGAAKGELGAAHYQGAG